jgi:hypothetical protein
VRLAEDAGAQLAGLDAKPAADRMDSRYRELDEAPSWFLDHGRAGEGLRMALALAEFWQSTGRITQGRELFGRALGGYGADDALRAEALFQANTAGGRAESAGRMWIGASGPASPVLRWYGRRVGSLGPGLTSESADAVRVVLRNDLSAGIQFLGSGANSVIGTALMMCCGPCRYKAPNFRARPRR